MAISHLQLQKKSISAWRGNSAEYSRVTLREIELTWWEENSQYPLDRGKDTLPIENKNAKGPYIYAVYTSEGEFKYIGKALEDTVLYRWIRPDRRNKTKYYWAHGATSPKAVSAAEKVVQIVNDHSKPVSIYFSNYSSLKLAVQEKFLRSGQDASKLSGIKTEDFIKELVHCVIYHLQPAWKIQGKKKFLQAQYVNTVAIGLFDISPIKALVRNRRYAALRSARRYVPKEI